MFCIIDPDNFTAGIDSLIMPPSFTTLDGSKFLPNSHHEGVGMYDQIGKRVVLTSKAAESPTCQGGCQAWPGRGSPPLRRTSSGFDLARYHCPALPVPEIFNTFENEELN